MSNRIICNSSAFLSGCLPVALIDFLLVVGFQSSNRDWRAEVFSYIFLALTVASSVCYYRFLQNKFQAASTVCKIEGLRRVNIFSSGAVSYYTLPFISFVGDNLQSAVILSVLVVILLIMFNNNMMFMYTPFLDFCGYKVLAGNIIFPTGENGKGETRRAYIVVKTDNRLYFSSSNGGLSEKVTEDMYFFIENGEQTEQCS